MTAQWRICEMDKMIEAVAKAIEPKCRGFGPGDMPMNVAREFARAAVEAAVIYAVTELASSTEDL